MDRIQYIEKPDWISWDAVMECLRKSHETNNQHGIHMLSQNMTGRELQDDIGTGKCFVALKGEQVIGTASVKFMRLNKWWGKDNLIAYLCHAGILKEFQGTAVFIGLYRLRDKFVNESGVEIVQTNTAEHNEGVLKLHLMRGFKYVQFSATGKGASYYSIIMVKWLKGCNYPDWYINFMYKLSKVVVKTLWKPGYKLRFWFS